MVSPFFPYGVSENEKHLIHSLMTEAIDLNGFGAYYCPRTLSSSLDRVFTEDDQTSFNLAVPTTFYLQSAEQFGGMGHFLDKTGWQIQDQIILLASKRTFEQEVVPYLPATIPAINNIATPSRPVEGDLIYVPFNQRLFVVRFVEKYSMLYPLGALPTWRLQCEVYEATGERFATGIPEIDQFETQTSLDIFRWAVKTENGLPVQVNGNWWVVDGYSPQAKAPEDQTQVAHQEANTFFDFTETNPFGDSS